MRVGEGQAETQVRVRGVAQRFDLGQGRHASDQRPTGRDIDEKKKRRLKEARQALKTIV